ncbi:MAG: bile acid:sodium symporter [Cyanobacteria bacterium]|nr:bile acid:sodium symporter [Cyanobacteriota bacterium]
MVQLIFKLPVFALMFALGLGLSGDWLALLRSRSGLMARLLLGSCLLVPLLTLVVLKGPLGAAVAPPAQLAIALMALCPSAPLTLRKAQEHGGDRDLAALLQVLAALTAIVSIPLLADLFRSSFGVQGWHIEPQQVAKQIISVQLLPLGLAVLVRRWRPDLANRLAAPIEKLAGLLLMLLIVVVLIKTFPLLAGYIPANGPALLVMVFVVLGSLVVGYGLGGPGRRDRVTGSLLTSMRNPGLALLFASLYAPTPEPVKVGILCFLLIRVLLSIPFLRWLRSEPVIGSPSAGAKA